MEKETVTRAYNRYEEILKILNSNSDERGLKLIKELLKKIFNYIENVTRFELFIKQKKYKLETECKDAEEYRETMQNLDNIRRLSHNALIDQLNIVNRYMFKNYRDETPIGGIYSLDPNSMKDRTAVADWAGYLAEAITRRNLPH
jgi:hypothetical protein